MPSLQERLLMRTLPVFDRQIKRVSSVKRKISVHHDKGCYMSIFLVQRRQFLSTSRTNDILYLVY